MSETTKPVVKHESSSSSSSTAPSPTPAAMSTIGILHPFDSTTDDFEVWAETFAAYLAANGLLDPQEDTAKAKVKGIFISSLGLPTYSLLKNFLSPEEPIQKELDDLIKTLTDYFKPAPKAIAERFRFMGRKQQSGESVSKFLAELRKLAVHCKFTDLDIRLRDQFIFGLQNERAQKSLFTKDDSINLKDVLASALAHELAETSTALIRGQQQSTEATNVHQSSSSRSHKKKGKSQNGQPQLQGEGSSTQQSGKNRNSNKKSCPNCGSSKHVTARECPHKDVICHNCEKPGHFARFCRSKSKNANLVNLDHVSDNRIVRAQVNNTKLNVTVGGMPHQMELDTGCETSILAEDFWKAQLNAPPLQKSSFVFRTYTNAMFHPLGDLETVISYNGQQHKHRIPVYKGTSLFGRDLLKHSK
ncbi:unnamed protein product [Orchesella dallaii]|uniref:CCHC-type domain-containing protein n=1 Tax=Orchesella dallaii TaxID=48710 RepID=A0ABP1RZF5_9HEXA